MNKHISISVILLLVSFFMKAQEKEKDSIDVQEVTVIKSYSPSLQDVFKILQSPEDILSEESKKQEVEYRIFSVPVASTFIPSKGSARKLIPKKIKPQFNSNASLGFGNFNQLLAEYSTYLALDRRQRIDWMFRYNGFLKNLPEEDLPTKQGHFLLNVSHQYATNKHNSFSQVNFRQHQQQFYGLRTPINDAFIRENFLPQQKLNYISITSKWQWYEPWVKQLALHSFLTTDSFSSSEVEVRFDSKIQQTFGGMAVSLLPQFTYLKTAFKEDFYTRLETDYDLGKADLALFASKIRGKFKFKVGAKGTYGVGDAFSEQPLYVFPEVSFTYLPVKGNFAPFLEADGDVVLNSYRSFTHENPYMAPGIRLEPTIIPYRFRLGTRSKFASGWEFSWNALYAEVNQHPIMQNLGADIDRSNVVAFRYGNAFESIYTDLTKSGVEAQLSAAFKNGGRLRFKAAYTDYTLKNQSDQPFAYPNALNLPELSLLFDGTLKWGEKISFQWHIKHLGARQNGYRDTFLGQELENAPVLFEDLAAFTQVDLHLNYQLNERWGFYLKGNNLTNEPFYQWSNYAVYGTQILVGMRYNFDLAF